MQNERPYFISHKWTVYATAFVRTRIGRPTIVNGPWIKKWSKLQIENYKVYWTFKLSWNKVIFTNESGWSYFKPSDLQFLVNHFFKTWDLMKQHFVILFDWQAYHPWQSQDILHWSKIVPSNVKYSALSMSSSIYHHWY